jgi:hypothetical protein
VVEPSAVTRTQQQLTQLGYAIPAAEQTAAELGEGTCAALEQFQSANALPQTGEADEATTATLATAIASHTYVVAGSVQSPALPGAGGTAVQLVDKNVGGNQVLASTQTAAGGAFSFSAVISPAYLAEHDKTQPDLQVQALSGETVLGSSEVHYSAPLTISLDVVVPAGTAGLPSEYETLSASLATAYSGSLAELQQSGAREDVTYLANKTGWDARMVAMAALAAQFSQLAVPARPQAPATAPADQPAPATPVFPPVAEPAPAQREATAQTAATGAPAATGTAATIRPELYYALFRAGLPANRETLFQTSPATVQSIWQQAIAQGVIPPALSEELPAAAKTYQALSAAQLLTAPPAVGVSTLGELLQSALPEAAAQQQFAQLYTQHSGDWEAFWPALEQALGADRSAQLQSLGQLYSLTLNNQPLVAALVKAAPANGAAAPANDAAAPANAATAPANAAAPPANAAAPPANAAAPPANAAAPPANAAAPPANAAAPPANAAAPPASGAGAAAAAAAPSELVAHGYYEASAWTPLIGAGAVPSQVPGEDPAEQASNYAELLAAQVRLAFPTAVLADQVSRGVVPIADTAAVASEVADFLNAQQGAFEIGVEPVEAFIARTALKGTSDAVIAQVKRLQRVYQLTPDDQSLVALLDNDLDSAYAITRYDPAGFVRAFSEKLGGAETAGTIHARARQVFVSVMSIAVEYLKGRVTPTLGGSAPVQYGYPPPTAPPPPSVVAYPTLEGLFGSQDFCSCSECGSILSPAAYLVDLLNFVDQPAPSKGYENPQEVLFARRPDLQYLPLTCANTNTALPYIDIVNETLEYYVANGLSIAGYEGHDTGEEVTSAELIASPQYVNDEAYTVLQGACFPPPLPFNRPLALLRLQLENMSIPVPEAMAALRSSDALIDAQTPTSYGWRDILIEQLAISRDEYRLFTDSTLELRGLYGLAGGLSTAEQLATLQKTSLQDFSRRLGVSYDDLVTIVKTQFFNPNAALIGLLEGLHCTFATLQQLNADPASQSAAFIAALPAGLDATQYGASTPDDRGAVVTWVTDHYARIVDIITITNTSGNADDCSGADLYFRYTNPASTELSGTDYLKLIRFVRLWRKLAPLLETSDEAAIEDTDNIVAALYPAAQEPLASNTDAANWQLLDEGFAIMLLRLGFLVQAMGRLSLSADAALDQLLACWGPIGTRGASSLYATLFLTPTLLQQDPGAQAATVASTIAAGDVLKTTINGVEGSSGATIEYKVPASPSAASVASAIAALINASTTIDPATQAVGHPVPIGERYLAESEGDTITIKAGFTLKCETSLGASETYASAHASGESPVLRTATVSGPFTAGDVLSTVIDTVAVPYTVRSSDTPESVAARIAQAVNATTLPDPYSGLPLNDLVVATSSGAVLTLLAANAGAPFTLACTLTPSGASSASGYTAGRRTPPFAGNGSGEFLTDSTQTLFGHEPTLCAACNVTGAEFQLIASALDYGASTPLTLATVSAVFRHGWLAHTLGLSVLEFLLLVAQSELDPFATLDPGAAPAAVQPPVIGFIALLDALGTAGVSTDQALYLMWNQDISGASTPSSDQVSELAVALRAAFATVAATFTLQDDPSGSIAQGLMTLVYGASTTDFFFGLLNGTFTTSVPYPAAPGVESLPAAVVEASGGRLGYEPVAKQLTFGGFLNSAAQAAIEAAITVVTSDGSDDLAAGTARVFTPASMANIHVGSALTIDTGAAQETVLVTATTPTTFTASTVNAHNGTVTPFPVVNDPTLAQTVKKLAAASLQAVSPFFAADEELKTLYLGYVASPAQSPEAKRNALLANFLPTLIDQRKQEQALATVTAAAGAEASFAAALLQDAAAVHAAADSSAAAVSDFTAIGQQGLSAQFYLSNDLAVPPDTELECVPRLSYTQADNPLPAASGGGGKIAAAWSGYLTVPQSGVYDINVLADAGATLTLEVAGEEVLGAPVGSLWSNKTGISLVAGELVPFVLTASSIATTLSVSWRSQGLGWQPIPSECLYAQQLMEHLSETYVRFLKLASLAEALSLSAQEIAYLASELGGGWPNRLVGAPSPLDLIAGPPPGGGSPSLTTVLQALLDFARIKQALSPKDSRLLAVLENPAAKLPGGQSALLSLTGWSEASLVALLTQFFGTGELANLGIVESFRRVYDAFAIVTKSRLAASVLISAITNAPTATTVGTLQSALRSQYAPADWLAAVTPINNAVRIAQRNALVAYILQQEGDRHDGFSTPEDLYAYLLIDPENEPPVLTSRILLATLTSQLFVERVTRNLEPQAAPADLNAAQWTWMKRYRVWQANREVFLWPENWLYPELRDNQSPFFGQATSTLLQGDITEEAATSAYLDYLTNLEEVAKLEACGVFYEPAGAETDETAYVVSRTAGAHRKHYFRELTSGSWTPWAQVQIDCEELPLAPIVWNGRLFLFWLKIVKGPVEEEAPQSGPTQPKGEISKFELTQLHEAQKARQSQSRVAIGAVLCWSEYYNGKWQPTKTSDVNLPTSLSGDEGQRLGYFEAHGPGSFEQTGMRSLLQIVPAWFALPSIPSDALVLAIVNQQGGATLGGFLLHNSHSLPVRMDDLGLPTELFTLSSIGLLNLVRPEPSRVLEPVLSPYTGAIEPGDFTIAYGDAAGKSFSKTVLGYTWVPRFIEAQPGLADAWDVPFIYENRRHMFYVTAAQTTVQFVKYKGFGVPLAQALAAHSIPPLMLNRPVAEPSPSEAALAAARAGASSLQRQLPNTNIAAALSSPGTVAYDGQAISLTGSIPGSSTNVEDQGER